MYKTITSTKIYLLYFIIYNYYFFYYNTIFNLLLLDTYD